MNKGPLFTVVILFIAGLGGCSIFPEHEPLRVADLTLQDLSYRAGQTQPYTLRIDTPYASEPFSSTRILAKPNGWEFRIYEGVRWRDTAPVIVRDMLVQALRASNGFTHVVSDTSPAVTDWGLITELTGFHTESYSGGVNAVIRLHSWILDNRSRNTLCSSSFTVSQPLAGPGIEQVVEGFNAAGETLSDSVSQWAAHCTEQVIQETVRAMPISGITP